MYKCSTHLSPIALVWILLRAIAPGVCSSENATSLLGPVVNVGYAAFAGNTTSPTGETNGPVTFFGGIKFAQSPLGNLRFRAPQPLDERHVSPANVTVSDARGWARPCVQQPAAEGVGSEDCLHLNVWKPTNATSKSKLPVVVYIYGGGFYAGTAQGFPMYDWVAQRPTGIVAVSITYRLNLLGFLSGSAVSADGDLNAGLLDQRAGLEWIQRHITAFGGDPSEVTIVGESAGGASVVMQIVAYAGSVKPPFRRAIAHSIGYGNEPNATKSEMNFQNATAIVGCPSTGKQAMACLRNASLPSLIQAINSAPEGAFSPVVDGSFLPELPSRLIEKGTFSKVDFIGGHCSNDGRTFVGGKPEQFVTDDDVRRLVFKRWPTVLNDTMDKAMELYPSPNATGSPYPTQYDRAWTMAQEIIFGCMDWWLADRMSAKGVKNVYNFRWNAADPVLLAASPYIGVMHTSDLYFLFDGTNTAPNAGFTFTPFNDTEAALSREAIAYWTSFAATGNPSSQKLSTSPEWTAFSYNVQRIVLSEATAGVVETASVMEPVPGDMIERCKFWMDEARTVETAI